MSTFNAKSLQKYQFRQKVDAARAGVQGVLAGAARLDAARGDFMAAMGAVVPSLMEQLKAMDTRAQQGPTVLDPAATTLAASDWINQLRTPRDPSRSLFSTKPKAGVELADLGVRVARLTGRLAGSMLTAAADEAPDTWAAHGFPSLGQDLLREPVADPAPTSRARDTVAVTTTTTTQPAPTTTTQPAPTTTTTVPAEGATVEPYSATSQIRTDDQGRVIYVDDDGTEVPVTETFGFDPGATLDPDSPEAAFQALLDLDRWRRASALGIDPDQIGAIFIDVFGDGERSPMARALERYTTGVQARDDLDQAMADLQTGKSTLAGEDRSLIRAGQRGVVQRMADIDQIDQARNTTTVMDFVESLDDLSTNELIEFQQALWAAGYYGNTFNVLDDDEPPFGERGQAFWSAVGHLMEDVAVHDNRWSVERWLAERAAFVQDLKTRGSGGRGPGGGGGGGRVVVRLSDPEAIRDAGNRFAQDEIGFELNADDHADLVEFVHGLERQLAAGLQAGGEVTEVDVAARIRAWIAERYPAARTASRMNDAWAAIRAFINQGA